MSSVPNNLSPAALFKLFFDQEVMSQILNFSNIYAQQKNRAGDISETVMFHRSASVKRLCVTAKKEDVLAKQP